MEFAIDNPILQESLIPIDGMIVSASTPGIQFNEATVEEFTEKLVMCMFMSDIFDELISDYPSYGDLEDSFIACEMYKSSRNSSIDEMNLRIEKFAAIAELNNFDIASSGLVAFEHVNPTVALF